MFQINRERNQEPLLACLPLDDENSVVSQDFRSMFLQWKAWGRGGELPAWSRFDPLDHAKLLQHIMLVEFDSGHVEDIRIVLMGEHVKEHFGFYPKGTLFRDAMPKSNFRAVVEANRFCADNAKAAYFIKTMDWRGRHLMIYELLKLPFVKSGGQVSVICLLRFDLEADHVSAVTARKSV